MWSKYKKGDSDMIWFVQYDKFGHHGMSLFRNKRFVLDEMFQRIASKFAILLEYEIVRSFCRFFHFVLGTLFFP